MSWSNAGWGSDDGGWYQNKIASGGNTAQATAFLARTSYTGSDATNFATLINGLVNTAATEGGTLFSRFDLLYIFAGPDQTNVLQNLVSSSFTAALTGTGNTFTAYQGFTPGASGGMGSGFNPTTAPSPLFTQNSAHMSLWNLVNSSIASPFAGGAAGGQAIFPKYSDNNVYLRINDVSSGFPITNPIGHLLGNRDGANSREGYQNATSVGTYGSVASVAVTNEQFLPMNGGTPFQGAMFSSGASLSATDVTNFYTLLHTCLHSLNPGVFP